MSGTFRIRPNTAWMPAAWAFDAILGWIAEELDGNDPALGDELREGSAEATGFGFVDVDGLPASRYRALVAASESVLDRLLLGPPSAVGGPETFLGLAAALIPLVALLRSDERLESAEHAHGMILLPHGEEWSAPDWLHDLVVEHLAADTAARGQDAIRLLAGRVRRGAGVLDLRLSHDEFVGQVVPTLRRLAKDYGDGIRIGAAPDVERLVAGAVLLLGKQAGADTVPDE